MQVAGERSHWDVEGSPLTLRSLPGTRFELDSGDEVVILDHDDDDPGASSARHQKEVLVKKNPSTGPRVMLISPAGTEEMPGGEVKLDAGGIDRIDRWLTEQDAAKRLTIEVASPVVTRREIGRLGDLADSHRLPVEVRLQGDG